MFGLNLIPIFIFLLFFLAIFSISIISLFDSAFINKIFLFIANLSSSTVFPTPEKTIFSGFILAFKALINSPFETTSAPKPNLLIWLKIFKLELDFTEKQIKGFIVLKFFLKLLILLFILS